MKQLACSNCNAPMWEGGRCPWDRGSGCVGRSLVVSEPRKRSESKPVAKVTPRPTPKAPSVWRPRTRALPKAEYDRQYAARRRAARTPEELEAARAKREPVIARCVWDHKIIEVHHGGPARKYCSARCRGRAARAAA